MPEIIKKTFPFMLFNKLSKICLLYVFLILTLTILLYADSLNVAIVLKVIDGDTLIYFPE